MTKSDYSEKHTGAVTLVYYRGRTVGKVMPAPHAGFGEDGDFDCFVIQGDRSDRVSAEMFPTRDEAIAELREQNERKLVVEGAGL